MRNKVIKSGTTKSLMFFNYGVRVSKCQKIIDVHHDAIHNYFLEGMKSHLGDEFTNIDLTYDDLQISLDLSPSIVDLDTSVFKPRLCGGILAKISYSATLLPNTKSMDMNILKLKNPALYNDYILSNMLDYQINAIMTDMTFINDVLEDLGIEY